MIEEGLNHSTIAGQARLWGRRRRQLELPDTSEGVPHAEKKQKLQRSRAGRWEMGGKKERIEHGKDREKTVRGV